VRPFSLDGAGCSWVLQKQEMQETQIARMSSLCFIMELHLLASGTMALRSTTHLSHFQK
jgi:hypothetical protein